MMRGRRILVVDDNRDAARSLAMLLELQGAEVRVAYRGEEALRAVHASDPQVVLLDIGMPGMNGYDVARRIREQGRREPRTLIAMTGWGEDDDRRRSREAGIDFHMVKPVDLNALYQLLATLPDDRAVTAPAA